MLRYLIAAALVTVLLPADMPARAETMHHAHPSMPAEMGPADAGSAVMADHDTAAPGGRLPTEPGQGAFAAIQEIVSILQADPATDWSKVDITALRNHLVDMDNVTLQARAEGVPVDGGMRFTVTGEGAVRDSIRRMVAAHARTMDGYKGWHYAAVDVPGGAALTVQVPPPDRAKLRGLGFFGVMAYGMHHQRHHLMIASGMSPHR